jgi:hypothetical protein
MKIDLAYCVELKRIVDIHDACEEFAIQDEYKEFSFLCSDEDCRASRDGGVRVTGVNHSRIPEESVVFKSPHFRKWDTHLSTCIWNELESAEKEAIQEEDKEEERRNRLRRKVTRLITLFIVPDDENREDHAARVNEHLNEIRSIDGKAERLKRLRSYVKGLGSTATSLEALVSCFLELQKEDVLSERFTIRGQGEFTFRDVFRHAKFGPTERFSIYYGGAHFLKPYGKGFSLLFMDRITSVSNGEQIKEQITFYVSSKMMEENRLGKKMAKIVEEAKKNKIKKPYLKVYWIGGLGKRQDGKGYEASFSSLAHVVMRLAYPAEQNTKIVPSPVEPG